MQEVQPSLRCCCRAAAFLPAQCPTSLGHQCLHGGSQRVESGETQPEVSVSASRLKQGFHWGGKKEKKRKEDENNPISHNTSPYYGMAQKGRRTAALRYVSEHVFAPWQSLFARSSSRSDGSSREAPSLCVLHLAWKRRCWVMSASVLRRGSWWPCPCMS